MPSNNYPSDWDSRRKAAYRRDGHQCQNCGRTGGSRGEAELHAHHVVPKAKGGSHDISNLITICNSCHKAVHGDMDAPTADSGGGYTTQNDTLPSRIKDISDMADVSREALEAMIEINDVMGKLTVESNSHKQFFDRGASQWKKVKQARSTLIETRLLYTNMEFDFDSYSSGDKSELKFRVAKKEHLIIKMIELELQDANVIDEYFELLSQVKCPNCDRKEVSDASFCGHCGEELPDAWECSDCGENIKELKQTYCNSCGSEVSSLPEEQVIRIESLRDRMEVKNEKMEEFADESSENDQKLAKFT